MSRWVNLRVHLQQPHKPRAPEYQRKPGPARLRRRAWRANARSAAAENAPAEANHEVVENATLNKNSALAGKVDLLPPTHVDVAYQDPTEEVDEILDHPTEYEQTDEECTTTNTERRIAELNVNAKPWYHGGYVQDEFCRDQE